MAKKSLEKLMSDLDEIVAELENGDLGLDESIKKYETGIKLYKNCREALGEAEKKIRILTDDLKEEEFEVFDEE